MSIDRDTFENTSEDELEELSVPDQVLGFLATNDDRAFKAREIASQIGVDEGAVSTALSRLKDRDYSEKHDQFFLEIGATGYRATYTNTNRIYKDGVTGQFSQI
ncbi:MarR family transcriptional regulator [Haloarcula sp. GH36]|uniref:MarR family transcriptional regulator n=1 Tax=Haloarcula montana TaxID=3111776 RepID=UPI002D76FF59|nr:helix-turn-helix domain-containing protein [Haloarcula sp. GH36]